MARNLITPKGKAAVVAGLPDLQKRILDIINVTVTGSQVKKVWMRAAIVLRNEARLRAPILKEETKRRAPGLLKKAIFAAYGPDDKPNVLVGVNYRIAPQAWLVEFGTAQRTTKAGKNRGISPAQPFMRPALAAKRAECVDILANGYRELIEASAK